jgi:hypothetical protein
VYLIVVDRPTSHVPPNVLLDVCGQARCAGPHVFDPVQEVHVVYIRRRSLAHGAIHVDTDARSNAAFIGILVEIQNNIAILVHEEWHRVATVGSGEKGYDRCIVGSV